MTPRTAPAERLGLAMRVRVLLLLFVCALPLTAGDYDYYEHIFYDSYDGTRLAGNLFLPVTDNQNETFPAIVFLNSWALEEHEYIIQARKFAQDGYIVFSYSSRGWGLSGGQVGVAGEKDMMDLSRSLDWLEEHTPIDVNNIGVSGISYGGGMSLLGAAHDDRIKTVVAMSCWADLGKSLYGGDTPRLVWGGILVGSGYLTGNMDPIIAQQYGNVVTGNNIPETLAWAAERSPITVIDEINRRNVPVYISQNWGDELFQPNPLFNYYERLTTPKRFDLSPGIHATAELGGLIGITNFIWNNAHDWFDYWLMGIDNGIMDEAPVTRSVKGADYRDEFNSWPSNDVSDTNFYLTPRGWFSNGDLQTQPNDWETYNRIYTGVLSGATTGVPVIGPIFEAHLEIPILTWVPGINRAIAVVHESDRFSQTQHIRGIPELDLWIKPSSSKAQMVVHLYDVDRLGTGTLITHGPLTLHNAQPGKTVRVSVELVATAYDIPAGHKLAVAIDTYDPQYGPPTLAPYHFDIIYRDNKQSVLKLPLAR